MTLDALRDRIRESDEISDEDRDALLRFSDELYLLSSMYTDSRHDKLLRHCTRMAENVGGLSRSLEEREAAEEIVRWIHRTYDNPSTDQDYRVALRVFGRRTTDVNCDEPPESIDRIPSTKDSSYNEEPDPNDMVRWDEVEEMVEETRYTRNAAMIAVAFDLGARSSEFRALTVGDISNGDDGMRVYIDGAKGTGGRSVSLVPSVPYLNRWLADHPAPTTATHPSGRSLTNPRSPPTRCSVRYSGRTLDAPASRRL